MNGLKEQKGWKLVSGEDTDLVASGTYQDCMDRLAQVNDCRVDQDTGISNWALLTPSGERYLEGKVFKVPRVANSANNKRKTNSSQLQQNDRNNQR